MINKIKEMYEDIKFDIENNIAMQLIITSIIVIGGVFVFISGKRYITNINTTKQAKSMLIKNNKSFSQFALLARSVTTNTSGSKSIVYDVYNTAPFNSSANIQQQVQQFINAVKLKYNTNGENKVATIAIRVYQRKLTFDYGLTPNAMFSYTYGAAILDNQKNQPAGDSPQAAMWSYSNNQKPSQINYSKYATNEQGGLSTNTINPLSDQEFSFWLHLKLYEEILNTTNFSMAVKAYLNFDLGIKASSSVITQTDTLFQQFNQREQSSNQTKFFPNHIMLTDYVAQYRPQLLYFLLTGKIQNSYTKAIKALIQNNPKEFSQLLTQHVNQAGKLHGGNVLYGDPFTKITGFKNKTLAQNFVVPFSPSITANNKFFGLEPSIN